MATYKKKLVSASIAAILATSIAQAQETQSPQLEEIVVTATRTETSLQNTPVAVTALSGDTLDQLSVTDLQDVAQFIPSLSIGDRPGGVGGGGIAMRGMGVDGIESAASVGIYVDDVYFASGPGNVLGLMDVERIEVLRGPQGTLFGRNTIGGAIQYITTEPDDEFGGYVGLTVGEMDRFDAEAALNIPVSDTFAMRVAAKTSERGGWVYDRLNSEDRGERKDTSFRLRAKWTPTDNLTANFKFETVEQETNGRATITTDVSPDAIFAAIANGISFGSGQGLFDFAAATADINLNPGDYSIPGFNNDKASTIFEMDTFSAHLSYDVSDNLNITSITSYTTSNSGGLFDFDGTPLPILTTLLADSDIDTFAQEVKFQGTALDGGLSYTAGVYYYDSELVENSFRDTQIGPVPEPNSPPGQETTNTSTSVFGQVSYDLTELFKLTLGIRYTDEDLKSTPVPGFVESSFNFTDSSPYIGLDYTPNDDAMIYAKVSKGFRAGGLSPSPNIPGGSQSFDPETAWTYEIGARLDLMDGRLRVNPTLFFTEWEDIQFNNIENFAGVPTPVVKNAGDAEITGLELEALYAATENLVIQVAYSYLDAEYTNVFPFTRLTFPNGIGFGPMGPTGGVVEPSIFEDTPLQRTPENKLTIGATYTTDLSDGSSVVSNVNYAWTDDQQSAVIVSGVNLPDYGLLNVRLAYLSADDKWSVAAYAN